MRKTFLFLVIVAASLGLLGLMPSPADTTLTDACELKRGLAGLACDDGTFGSSWIDRQDTTRRTGLEVYRNERQYGVPVEPQAVNFPSLVVERRSKGLSLVREVCHVCTHAVDEEEDGTASAG